MKKFRSLAVVALVLLALGSFGSVAFARENGRNDRNRSENRSDRSSDRDKRGDKENNADDKGTVTDDGVTTVESAE